MSDNEYIITSEDGKRFYKKLMEDEPWFLPGGMCTDKEWILNLYPMHLETLDELGIEYKKREKPLGCPLCGAKLNNE
jgi:hypothetical protein